MLKYFFFWKKQNLFYWVSHIQYSDEINPRWYKTKRKNHTHCKRQGYWISTHHTLDIYNTYASVTQSYNRWLYNTSQIIHNDFNDLLVIYHFKAWVSLKRNIKFYSSDLFHILWLLYFMIHKRDWISAILILNVMLKVTENTTKQSTSMTCDAQSDNWTVDPL